ncbi:MAG: hypothetical protein IKL13_01930 [Clostridia bacterium]|nr:hypothetical protein [Clostridia bacterium]
MNGKAYTKLIGFVGWLVAACVLLPGLLLPISDGMGTTVDPGKTGNMVIVYGVVAMFSVLLLIGYTWLAKQRDSRFVLLFSCVATTNCGYFWLSCSRSLTSAMMANRLSYLGAAFAVLVMMFIVMDACRVERKKWLTYLLIGISTTAFLIAASGDWFGLYYKAVSIESIDGMTRLVKDYGPLHPLYPVYLLSYFVTMVITIIHSHRKGNLSSAKYAFFLVGVVLTNLIVWGVEQAVRVNFEFLSVSYIATELMLLSVYSMLQDYGIVQPGGSLVSVQMLTQLNTRSTSELPPEMEELFVSFAAKVKLLSSAERRILHHYIDGYDISDIPELAFISSNTVKKHNHSIYKKLEVASRDELMLYIELFRCCDRLDELISENIEN